MEQAPSLRPSVDNASRSHSVYTREWTESERGQSPEYEDQGPLRSGGGLKKKTVYMQERCLEKRENCPCETWNHEYAELRIGGQLSQPAELNQPSDGGARPV